ncbi:hypothetical protein M422DRAFT_177549 [Sphaerobolus stellatus SS14]|uniref:Retrotransposon gag domain-containing protein n=1 Tax=Sphaerobolus stellatus (strain SS14) TaxID=990650 RepID=A0A0C9USJ1_SPHS4|nr:hypothetical protein M422DRAFT_177549 [Sphaerobolus stellatus SS14]
MSHVARVTSKYSLRTFYQGLFEYCFSLNFRRKLRDRLLAMRQGNRSVRDFKRELERLGTWLSDVIDKDMAFQFWKGIHSYLHVELAGEDMDHKNSSLEELAKYATRFEN